MIFTSVHYLMFLGFNLLICNKLKTIQSQKWLLVISSTIFYSFWDWRFIFLLWGSFSITYAFGYALFNAKKETRKSWLAAGVTFNLVVLGIFKYLHMILDLLSPITALSGFSQPHLNIILPVAISFITFEQISYLVDIYRKDSEISGKFIDFAVLVSFFPHLIAGPILRPSQFMTQLQNRLSPSKDDILKGSQLLFLGIVKKVLIADHFSKMADAVFLHPSAYDSVSIWMAVLSYAGQIYFDFSAYSDMAIGSARCFGLVIPRNFHLPYLSQNPSEFWRRWHISLSSWLRDYLYIPLGGNRFGSIRTYVNLLTVMLLGGLWHGAGINFVIWGAIHGFALSIHRLWSMKIHVQPTYFIRFTNTLLCFFLVTISWIPFRLGTFTDVSTVIRSAFLPAVAGKMHFIYMWLPIPIILAPLIDALVERVYSEKHFNMRSPVVWFFFTVLVWALLLLKPLDSSPFIYFQF